MEMETVAIIMIIVAGCIEVFLIGFFFAYNYIMYRRKKRQVN